MGGLNVLAAIGVLKEVKSILADVNEVGNLNWDEIFEPEDSWGEE